MGCDLGAELRTLALCLSLVGCATETVPTCDQRDVVCEIATDQTRGEHRSCYCNTPPKDDPLFCKDSLTCPTGTECVEPEDGERSCRIPDPDDFDRRVLADEFRRPLFDFEQPSLSDETSPQDLLLWKGPEGTEHIVCALFACDPVIGRPTEGARLEILNFNRCALNRVEEAGRKVEWSLSGGRHKDKYDHACHPGLGEDHECPCERYMRPTRITRACWAYSDWVIVGVSRLRLVDDEVIASLDPPPGNAWVRECTAATEGRACHMPWDETRVFGACRSGLCLGDDPTELECLP